MIMSRYSTRVHHKTIMVSPLEVRDEKRSCAVVMRGLTLYLMKISERADHASDRRQQQTDIGWDLGAQKKQFKTVRRSPATQIPLLQTKYYYLHAQLSTFNFESSMQ